MTEQKISPPDLKQLRCWSLTAFVFWTLLVNGSLCLFARGEWNNLKFIGKEIGLTAIRKDYIYQVWNSGHGGIQTADSRAELINPARMTREVYQLEEKRYGIRGNITSLRPLHPENSPDSWEEAALRRFEAGEADAAELIRKDGGAMMRVMLPTVMDQSCLKCHVESGYKLGSIRGGISVTLPMDELVALFRRQFKTGLFYHLLIYLIGVSGMAVFYLQSSRQLFRRTEMEARLSAQEQHLRGIVDNISNGIAVYETADGKDFVIRRINPAGMRIARLNGGGDAAGRRPEEVFPGFAQSGLLEVFRRVAQSGVPEHLSVPSCIQRKKNSWNDETGLPCLEHYIYKLPTGEIVAVYEDVTSRRQARELLIRKTEEWESTFDAIPDIITLQDKDMRIIRANQAAFEFFRLPPEELVGRTCHSLFRGCDQPCQGCPGQRAMQDFKKHCVSMEHKAVSRHFHVCAAPVLNPDGEFLYFVYIAHDTTDKRKLEEELLQAQKMEAIGTLAGGIAHDFNNILAAILGYTELARMELPEGSGARGDLDQVIIAGNRATELVKQILTFSRKSEHRKKPLRIYIVVKEALKMLRSSLPSSIVMQTEIDERSGLVLADPTSIHQIVFNLCTNAAQAIGERQGRIEIILRETSLSAEQREDRPWLQPGRFLVLTVRDNGSGMDEKTKARIFDPYFTTKEPGAGTGLGLAVTHGVVEDCQGFIEVESALGQGSAFHVYLPVLPEEEKEQTEAEAEISLPGGAERILLVDDEPSIVHISDAILSTLGYHVTAEMDSVAALERFKSDPAAFDLLLTDQTMPGLTGSELAKAALQMRPDLPVILCTGYTAALSERDALALGIRRYAIKPLNTAKLAALVREALDEAKRG
ncbi:PAS domain-containing protein [Candidatus Electronema sp. JC]|uniref:hybrid sensor histidine kinase/response regulator n=1 Tax=Candidatus Electronema sp. JC TaxID=3401570 RepID=UPI003AA94AE1